MYRAIVLALCVVGLVGQSTMIADDASGMDGFSAIGRLNDERLENSQTRPVDGLGLDGQSRIGSPIFKIANPADFDEDGDVDDEDYAAWSIGFGNGSSKAEGDADLDGDVDGDDFLVWQASFRSPIIPTGGGASGADGLQSSSLRLDTSRVHAVPEPAGAVLLSLALLAGLGIIRRRR